MDSDTIKTLINAMTASDLAEMDFSQDGWTLRLVRYNGQPTAKPSPAQARSKPQEAVARQHQIQQDAVSVEVAESPIEAPMFGIVYMRPNPDAPDFATVGTKVSAGTTLCLIESMKMFSEVKADRSGVIERILVQSGDEVDAGQPLIIVARDNV